MTFSDPQAVDRVSKYFPPYPDSAAKYLKRRLVTFPVQFLITAVAVLGYPVLLVLSFIADVATGKISKLPFARLITLVAVFGILNVVTLFALFLAWIGFVVLKLVAGDRTYAWFHKWNHTIQYYSAISLFRSWLFIYSMKVQSTCEESVESIRDGGPYIMLQQHTGFADTFLPSNIMTVHYNLVPRYVIKKELKAIPLVDVMGNRVPTFFLDRETKDSNLEVERMKHLMCNLDPWQFVEIWPEGTRRTEAKHQKVLQSLRDRNSSQLAAAEKLQHVMPPRVGGALGLLEANTEGRDILFFCNLGLEKCVSARTMTNGGLVGTKIRTHLWKVKWADVPKDSKARAKWLFDQWAKVDAWVGYQKSLEDSSDATRKSKKE
eukprot:GFYU01004518.1.p1 GENE.GFYU01004518.1~~GFYU01004518.1.p1  ORF type:complete len:377 (-),score=88.16 GFYU01004518.1:38-1168(-)